MKFLLDTNICIYVINKRPQSVIQRFRQFESQEIGISTVTVSELHYGACKSGRPEQNKAALEYFLSPLRVMNYDEAAARAYGIIRAELEKKGAIIGSLDMMIAAHAFSLGIPVVTNNVKEFKRVSELHVENWIDT